MTTVPNPFPHTEFADKYGWKNDPEKATLLKLDE